MFLKLCSKLKRSKIVRREHSFARPSPFELPSPVRTFRRSNAVNKSSTVTFNVEAPTFPSAGDVVSLKNQHSSIASHSSQIVSSG